MIEIAPADEFGVPQPAPAYQPSPRIRDQPSPPAVRSFLPAVSEHADAADPARFTRLAAAVGAALAALAGTDCSAEPVGCDRAEDCDGATSAASASLAALLVAVRFGGGTGEPPLPGGSAVRRMRTRLAARLDALAAEHWPHDVPTPGVSLSVAIGGDTHMVWLAAPARSETPVAAVPAMAAALNALPFRLPLAVSSETVDLSRLLPFVTGTIWPISPQPLVPLRIGGRRIATARIEPTPDGRQQAVIIQRDAR